LKFSSILGQDKVKEKLIAQVKSNRISHAQLFSSTEGCNALPIAVAFGQYINCTNKEDEDSCGSCHSCNKYQQLIHPDLHFSFPFISQPKIREVADDYINEFRKAFLENPSLNLNDWVTFMEESTKNPNINVNEIRNISKKLGLKAYEAEYKVMIIWLPEYLGLEGNKLLKILEEPPDKTLFLLVSESPQMLLSTIISRTQHIKIPNYNRSEIESYLLNSNLTDLNKAKNIALLSNGNLNKAIKLSFEINTSLLLQVKNFFNICYKNDTQSVLNFIEKMKDREEMKNFLLYTLEIIRLSNISEILTTSNPNNEEEEKLAFTLSKLLNLDNRIKVYRTINQALYEIDRNGNMFLILINISLSLRNNFKKDLKVGSN
jgi:DNA polymerase III subunit delta'